MMTYFLHSVEYSRYRPLWRVVLCWLFLLIGGCSILPKSPEIQVYLLPTQLPVQPVVSNVAAGEKLNQSLRIAQPTTSQFLNSSRIAVQPQGEQISVFAGSRWSDPVPILLRNRLIQEFVANGHIRAVSSDDDNLQADLELGGDLTAFQGVYRNGSSEVLIRFNARLIRTSDRRIIANRHFEIRQSITGTAMSEVIPAFGVASDRLATQLVQWTLQQAQ